MESKIGGGLSIIGGIILFLSIPFALFLMVEFVSAEVGFDVTFEEVLSALKEELPTLYTTIIAGIAVNIVFGCLLLVFGGLFIVGKGTGTIAILAIVVGILSVVMSLAIIGGIVGLIGGVLGIVGGALSRKKKEPEVLPPPSFPTTGAET